MMGHASRAMTLDTYGDANADAISLANEKLAEQFNASMPDYKMESEEEDE
jgi:hypothetical protein